MKLVHPLLKLLLLCLMAMGSTSQLSAQSFSMLSWNIQNLGRSKSADEKQAMVDIMRAYDLVLIQEVVAKDPAGARAVAWLADALNRTGSRWDYRVSDPTQSPSAHISERYAFLWNSSRLTMQGRPWLDARLAGLINREPYLARFQVKGSQRIFTVANYHARRFDQGPEEEIQYLVQYPDRFESEAVLIAGDFNLDESHPVWNSLYEQGFICALRDTPTTLKRKCKRSGEYFNYPIDNVYFSREQFSLKRAERVDFVKGCENLDAARGISDHLPVGVLLSFL